MRPFDDMERSEGTLTRVDRHDDGSYSVTSSTGWSCGVAKEHGVRPKVGDEFVTWGSIGRPIRGQAINGHVLYYRTPAEQKVEDQKRSDEYEVRKLAEYEGKRDDFDRRVAALPDPLRERIEKFRAFKGDSWRWEFEPYELFVCEEAAKIAAHLNTARAIERFGKLSYEQQKEAFPQMSDQHSGNTFGAAVTIAYALADKSEYVWQMHGALCPLVGCGDYGCYAAREKVSA
jgi:hypothetical protein